jgi:hypothetical protein
MKWVFNILVAIVLIVAGFYWLNAHIYDEKQGGEADYKNIQFRMSGETVQLVNGEATTQTTMGGASQSTVRYFGNNAKGDLNGDSVPDLAFLITQQSGGSGTFYYAVGAIQNAAGRFIGTDAVLLGDRIAPQSTEIRDGLLIVNYADRAPGEPMVAQPSVGKSLYLKLDAQTLQFGEVVQNFEGETGMGPRRKAGNTLGVEAGSRNFSAEKYP